MESKYDLLTFPGSQAWRAWLERHHDRESEAWVVIFKKGVKEDALTFQEAQDEALCFGWTDVKSKGIDEERYSLRFTPRKPGSSWSISNVRRAEQLNEEGRIAAPGLEKIAEAKRNGMWEAAIRSADTEVIPSELEAALRRRKGALEGYRSLKDSRKRQLVHSILTAKTSETRARRIQSVVEEAARHGSGPD